MRTILHRIGIADDHTIIEGSQGIAIEQSDVNLNARLSRFMWSTGIAGATLAVVLGYNSIQTTRAVNQVKADAVTLASQTAIVASQRVASCNYNKSFASIIHEWAAELSRDDSLAKSAPFRNARAKSFHNLFSRLDSLGAACLKAPTVPKT